MMFRPGDESWQPELFPSRKFATLLSCPGRCCPADPVAIRQSLEISEADEFSTQAGEIEMNLRQPSTDFVLRINDAGDESGHDLKQYRSPDFASGRDRSESTAVEPAVDDQLLVPPGDVPTSRLRWPKCEQCHPGCGIALVALAHSTTNERLKIFVPGHRSAHLARTTVPSPRAIT